MPVKGRSFGQERPPLTDILKNILLRYPDGGQILKEIIQNADDAGANEVKFLFDATTYGTGSLVSSELELFQGPALYSYNNAQFTDEDWEGLQRLMRSSKENNPLKVGRFGIGFNSVYHITDLPSIVSGNTVAFLDPHEKYFVRGQPGQAFSTEEPLLDENFDQFEPFHNMFDCNLRSQGSCYSSTLFRFPLRTQPSSLSNKIYTKEMINGLFDSFKNEASAILLFLKNVDSISLYRREQRGAISHLYTVRVSEQSKTEVRKKRRELIEGISLEWNFAMKSVFYHLEIEKQCPGRFSEKNKWFVANQVGTGERKLIELARSLKLLPWIGIASPLDDTNDAASLGRIFCFLPLPPDGDCRTGLPVQVNGYFGLTDNRRALKWPGPDCQNDDTAMWNELLLQKVGSQVYANLILNMVRDRSAHLTPQSLAKLVYSALPDPSHVRQDWRCILQQFFTTILAREIFLSTVNGNPRWIGLGEAIIDRLDETNDMKEEIKRVVLSTLLSAGQPIVSLPRHVLGIIDNFHQISGWRNLRKITPELLCNVLRSDYNFHALPKAFEEKLFVLEYALQNIPGNIPSLHGVPLLPLENGEFTKFQSLSSFSSVEKIFIPSEKHSVDLVPNMKHRFLLRNLPPQVQQKLNQLASYGATQLSYPTPNDIKQLLWESLPADWNHPQLATVTWNPGVGGHPTLARLELLWKWINQHFTNNLSEFEGMPLIPVTVNPPSSMARLSRNSTIIVREHSLCVETLSVAVRQLLVKSGCVVIEKLPHFLQHGQLLQYIALPTASGILGVLSAAKEKVIQQLAAASNEVKIELCRILSSLARVTLDQRSFIRTLPIFETVDGRNFLSCDTEPGRQRLVAPRNFSLPEGIRIVDQTKVLSSAKDENDVLLRKLGMKIETTASLIKIHLEDFLSNSGIKNDEKDKLMLWILERMDILSQEMPRAFVEFIRQLACIPTGSGRRRAPNQLFDHSDGLLKRLLEGDNDAFPTETFSMPMQRRKNGLNVRRRENLTGQDVFLIVKRSSVLNHDRGMALVELLNQQQRLLREYTTDGMLLANALRELPWLPRVHNRPANYPDFMPWYDGMNVCKPSSMYPDSLALLVGAIAPVYNKTMITGEVQKLLGMSETLAPERIVEQLSLAVVSWKNKATKPAPSKMTLARFEVMIKAIYQCLSQAKIPNVQQLLRANSLTEWLWHGSGFTSPNKVAFQSPFPKSINFHPYLFLLPSELHVLKTFLLSLGVKQVFKVDDLLDMLWCIKEKHDDEEREDVIQDFELCRAVLEWIVRSGGVLSEDLRSRLLIPVDAPPNRLQLEPCNTCMYCDREFLRRGVSENEIRTQSHLIHKAIPDDLASRLQVPRLSSCLAKAKPLGIKFKEAGQYEPLTTRLRNILQQYKEGVAIFKEIIQNADDAGATEVCFVVDWRENPRGRLLTEELAKCQGPALWAYNNAMFSEKDFENINKLAGETKKDELDKVGRFGLGFNSVYHLTDVPSFVSGEHLVFFDPNMSHISKLIESNRRQGGIMLNLAENKDALSSFPDQFLPYNQMFGCDMTNTDTFHFEGTLFRLPFRTTVQAQESEISKDPYTQENVSNVVKSLKESASTLLLFTQNVKEVRLFEIQKSSNPKKSLSRPIISITKSIKKTLETNNADKCGNGTILQNASTWLLNSQRSKKVSAEEGPRRAEMLAIKVSMVQSDQSNVPVQQKNDTWIVNSCTGNRKALEVAKSIHGVRNGVVPVTGTAAKISRSNFSDGNIRDVQVFSIPGEVFCFMPLSIESGFPVHVNGSFSVYSNRRRLWEEGIGEQNALKPFEAQWNEALMEDSLVQAYLQLLQMLTSYTDEKYEFHSLWPNPVNVNYPKAWRPFLVSFFNKIIDEEWPLFYCNRRWRRLHDCLILDPKLAKVADCVTIMHLIDENVLSLPEDLMKAFTSSGKEDFIKSHTLTEDRFLREFFFPRVAQIPSQFRNSVLLHILDRRLSKHRNYDDLLREYPSFSCSKDDRSLRKPNELVHPKRKAARLFFEDEKRFPMDGRFLEKERAMMLEELGMAIDLLPWQTLCERAECISNRCDATKAALLVKYMNQTPPERAISPEETERLRTAEFLPILSKPKDHPFPWKSDEHPTKKLASANGLYPEQHKYLVGSSQLILDESTPNVSMPNQSLKRILGITSKQPVLLDVITQLDHVIRMSHQLAKEKKEAVCSKMYEFFQKVVSNKKDKSQKTNLRNLRTELECRAWMLVKGQMVHPKLVAKNWKQDCSPYLFSLPPGYSTKYEFLIRWYGIKENFCQEDFMQAASKLRQDTGQKKLGNDQIGTLIVLLEQVFIFSKTNKTKLENVALPLPSVEGQLYDAGELVINDTPWLETDGKTKHVHGKVPVELAYKCGAKSLRHADLTNCSQPIGLPFGQHEELTDRLKNILKAYPSDEGILKELLQNADDAKANEIHFVFDPRTHGSKHVFSPNWKDLQGPAICVYNDKPFSKEDIEGIQKLGIGSKIDDPQKTGQYGIGFNAVYHLTDCPYFISDDDVICISDPHTKYAPGANEKAPGRLFNKLDEMFRRNYQDVFSGFLGDLFDLKGSTMFRFPLRGHAKLRSKISSTRWDDSTVKKLLESFRFTAKKMLLFLNNVSKISISEIKDGELQTYSVMCEVSDAGERAEFFEKMRTYSAMPTEQIPWHVIHYVMKISDSNNVKADWLITQSLGYMGKDDDLQVPNGTTLGLLPRAGIAAQLSSSDPHSPPFRHTLFCVLPLPVSTKFPVHINGHFALDSARRDLWHDDPKNPDFRVLWNYFMKEHVIAPAYANALYHARLRILGYHYESDTEGVFSSKKEADDGLRWYHQLFPAIADLDEAWKPVAKALFKYYLPLLSVLPVAMSVPERKKRTQPSFSSSQVKPECSTTSPEENAKVELKPVNVNWCKVSDAYFCTPEMSFSLEESLLEIGFRLLSHTSNKIHDSFKTVKVCEDVSPQRVREFLQNHGGIKEDLPKDVKNTALRDDGSVKDLTKYCAKAEDFFENLVGVPLLLTQDGVLRVFSSDPAVFCSRFYPLLPSRPDLFLHNKLRSHYSSNLEKCSNVIREFLIPDLAKYQVDLFPSAWINNASHQPWNPEDENAFPSKEWIKLIWEFIDDIASDSKRNGEKENKDGNESKPSNILANIAGCHIIPTTNNCLVPVSMGKTVLNVSTYLNSDSTLDKARRELLVKLCCPQLNHAILTLTFTAYSSSSGGATAVRKHYLAMVQSTKDVLGLLHQTLNSNTGREAALKDDEIETLLMFLQSDTSNLSRSQLKDLPFYQTINSTYIRLSACSSVYQVPASVPGDDLEVLSRVTYSIFLRDSPKLPDLYKYIGVTNASSAHFYLNVVLKNFNHLSSEGRVNHLKYVRDYLLLHWCDGYNSILSALKQLRFIPDHSGTLRTAKEFYDPENEVFKKFVPNEKFPPSLFDSVEWKGFLKNAGLQYVVTEEHVFQYARELQAESRNLTDPNSNEAKEVLKKSRILISHLFQNQSMHTSQFLSQVSKIHFVPAAKIKQLYLDIHPAHTQSILTCYNGSVIKKNKTLVWSSASLIQTSAAPNREDLIKLLGIHSRPPHDLVISHVKNISDRFPAEKNQEVPKKLHEILSDVMRKIYEYFRDSCPQKSGPSSKCTNDCRSTANGLRDVPVILVDRHTFVRGKQLAFTGVWDNMKPYMFNIPRELSHLEHFLKCLGAQERPTPLQYSSVLEAIKTSCEDNQMEPNEISAAFARRAACFRG